MKSKVNKPYKVAWKKGLSMDDWGKVRQEIEGIGNPDIVRIGASDVSVITKTNKWKCPQRLFYHLTGYHSSFFITERTLAGHLMENVTISRWESWVADEQESLTNTLHGIKVRKMAKANYFLLNDSFPNSFVSLDYTPKGKQYSPFTGELYPNIMPVELKHTNLNYYKNWEDGCAKQYYEQIQYQMLISKTDVALLLVMIDGVTFKVKEIYADKGVQDHIMYCLNNFVEKVKVGKMALQGMKEARELGDEATYTSFAEIFESVTPEPLGMDDNVELMQEIYADAIDTDANVKDGDEIDEYNMNQYLKCIKVSNAIDDYKKLVKVKLLKSCGEWEGIKVGDRKLTNRRATNFKKAYFSVK